MTTRLDPSRPLLWRTPHSLQIGVDDAVVVEHVESGAEHLIAALQAGFPAAVEHRLADAFTLEPPEFERLMTTLGPVIQRASAPGRRSGRACRVAVDGSGPTARRLRDLLTDQSSVEVVVPGSDEDATAPGVIDLAVLCADFVLPPSRYARWLRNDIPHLPIVFGDRSVRVGPFVTPGDGPCLHCLELHRTDEDPAWPALASQLLRRTSPLDTALLSAETAARAARLVLRRATADRPVLAGTQLIIDATTGALRRRVVREHSKCACRALQGSATAPASHHAAGPPTTTGSTAASPE